jgi:hypothetical protein
VKQLELRSLLREASRSEAARLAAVQMSLILGSRASSDHVVIRLRFDPSRLSSPECEERISHRLMRSLSSRPKSAVWRSPQTMHAVR